jgi:lysozyme family protein
MTDVYALIDEVIAREGGYSNHSDDRGGATRWGITQAVARKHGYAGNMRTLPREIAVAIYRDIYWTKPGLNKIADLAPYLAAELFDTAVNMGTRTAIRFLQRSLNALQRGDGKALLLLDGVIGARSMTALQKYLKKRGVKGERILTRAIDSLQGAKYIRLAEKRPANRTFLFGWLANRVGTV